MEKPYPPPPNTDKLTELAEGGVEYTHEEFQAILREGRSNPLYRRALNHYKGCATCQTALPNPTN